MLLVIIMLLSIMIGLLFWHEKQGRSNGLKGGGTPKISARAFGARMDITRNFSAKIFRKVLRVKVNKRNIFANNKRFRQNEGYLQPRKTKLSIFRAPTAKSRNFREL